MSAPTMEERKACWGARDELWQCLDRHTEDDTKCKELRLAFEARCPQQWVIFVHSSENSKAIDYLRHYFYVHGSNTAFTTGNWKFTFRMVKYFDRRRDFLKYKKKLETEGYHPPEAAGKS